MVYSDQYKFIFFAVPKTGSRSIQDYLEKFGIRSKTGWDPNHNNYQQVKQKLGRERCDNYFKFAFFRNPWSMLISVFYWNKTEHQIPLNSKGVIQWLNAYRSSDSYAPYIFDENGRVVLDFIGKLENIKNDFRIVCKKIGVPEPEVIPHVGRQNYSGRLHYTQYYETYQLKEKVRQIFERSLKILQYGFENG